MLQVKVFKGYQPVQDQQYTSKVKPIEEVVNEWLEQHQNNYQIFEITHATGNDYVSVLVTYDNDKAALQKAEQERLRSNIMPVKA